MPRLFYFEDLQITCANCIPDVEQDVKDHATRLNIELADCKYTVGNKTACIAINDKSPLSDEELEDEIRNVLADWLPKKGAIRNQYHLLQADIGIFTGATMMALMFLDVEFPIWAHNLMLYGGIAIISVISFPSMKKAWKALWSKQKTLNMDSLFALSTVAAVVASLLHPYFDALPMMVDAALMINGFRHFGLWIDESLKKPVETRQKFVDSGRKSLFQIMQNGQYIDNPDKGNDNPLIGIAMGTVIKVPKGQCIPLNGTLLDEAACVTFAIDSGKEEIVNVAKGCQLFSGMIVESETLTLRVNQMEGTSYLRMRDLSLIDAQSKTAPIQDLTSKILTWFMPVVLFFAVAVGGISGYFNGVGSGMQALLYFMVCACPCALGMVTPLGVNVGLKKLSDDKVNFKTPKGMQAVAQADTFVFDLNGTLTKNKLEIKRCTVNSEHFSVIHAMENDSEHIFGQLIADFVSKNNSIKQVILNPASSSVHHGIERTVTNGNITDTYRIGNQEFINPSYKDKVNNFEGAQHAIYFSKNGKVEGYFLLEDPLRDKHNAAALIKNLNDNGIRVLVYTGASQDVALQYVDQLGLTIKDFVTNCVPTAEGDNNKCALIKKLQEKGHIVAMFGDAANDSDAIKAADCGVVVYSRSTHRMTEQESDACITSDTLLLQALKIVAVGRQTMRHIKQNLAISFAYNTLSLVYVGCAVFLKPDLLNPAFGAGLMVFQSLFIVLNAMRINHQKATLPVEYKPAITREHVAPVISLRPKSSSNCVHEPSFRICDLPAEPRNRLYPFG